MKASSFASTEQYEALRQNALGRERIFSADPLGAIFVIKSGVAGWMRQWRQPAGEYSAARPAPPAPFSVPDWQRELTLVLAQITVRHLSLSPS